MAEGPSTFCPRSLPETDPKCRYQATKEDDYWLAATHQFRLHKITMARGPSDEQQFEAFEIG